METMTKGAHGGFLVWGWGAAMRGMHRHASRPVGPTRDGETIWWMEKGTNKETVNTITNVVPLSAAGTRNSRP